MIVNYQLQLLTTMTLLLSTIGIQNVLDRSN